MKKIVYKRILLKLTGELFGFENGKGINFSAYQRISTKLKTILKETNIELVLVVGGGNIFRGREKSSNVDEATADYMGMISTVLNGLALQEALEREGVPTRMMTAFEIKAIAEPYIRRRALRHLEKGRIVILTGGIGSPFFTTDTGAALRAAELNCDVIFKATNVDGIYNSDPKKNKNAKLLKKIDYLTAIKKDLKIMDASAFDICKKKNIPIVVFNINKLAQIQNIAKGEKIGTLVSS